MGELKTDMSSKRYYLLNRYPDFYFLTEEEVQEGWHFCPEWDYLLVGPGTPEAELCTCFENIQGVDDAGGDKKDRSTGTRQGVCSKDDADR